MFTTKLSFSGLTDLYLPSGIWTYRPGNEKVDKSVIKPESACSGVVNFRPCSSTLSYLTPVCPLGKYLIVRNVAIESFSNH